MHPAKHARSKFTRGGDVQTWPENAVRPRARAGATSIPSFGGTRRTAAAAKRASFLRRAAFRSPFSVFAHCHHVCVLFSRHRSAFLSRANRTARRDAPVARRDAPRFFTTTVATESRRLAHHERLTACASSASLDLPRRRSDASAGGKKRSAAAAISSTCVWPYSRAPSSRRSVVPFTHSTPFMTFLSYGTRYTIEVYAVRRQWSEGALGNRRSIQDGGGGGFPHNPPRVG